MSESVKKQKKRRGLRFSLRAFLVYVAGFAVWMGWLAHQAELQRAAVRWVEDHGGSVTYHYETAAHPNASRVVNGEIVIAKVMAPNPPVPEWILRFLDINFFSSVVQVHLSLTDIDEIRPLHCLSQLEYLNLGGTQVDSNDIESLKAVLPDCEIVPPSDTQLLDPFQ